MVRTTHAVAESGSAATVPLERGFAQDPDRVIDAMGSDLEHGLTQADAGARLSRFGPNQIASEKPPSVWAVSLQQLRDPMNLMLVAVVTVSVLIGELSTAAIVGALVVVNVVNVVLGARQELSSRSTGGSSDRRPWRSKRPRSPWRARPWPRPPAPFPTRTSRSATGRTCCSRTRR